MSTIKRLLAKLTMSRKVKTFMRRAKTWDSPSNPIPSMPKSFFSPSPHVDSNLEKKEVGNEEELHSLALYPLYVWK